MSARCCNCHNGLRLPHSVRRPVYGPGSPQQRPGPIRRLDLDSLHSPNSPPQLDRLGRLRFAHQPLPRPIGNPICNICCTNLGQCAPTLGLHITPSLTRRPRPSTCARSRSSPGAPGKEAGALAPPPKNCFETDHVMTHLGRVGNVDLTDLRAVAAYRAVELLLLQVRHSHQTALVADV